MQASPWIVRWSHLLRADCTVLDVGCGGGRHVKWFAQRGHAVTGVDKDVAQVEEGILGIELVQADIENGPWPMLDHGMPKQFGAVVVTNYLWRPLLPTLLQSLAPGGVLLFETFAVGNAQWGKPSRPDFLLQQGELLKICDSLHIVAYENGRLDQPARSVQRIAAVRQNTSIDNGGYPALYAL
jgi:SAM-dependent methyltransferase